MAPFLQAYSRTQPAGFLPMMKLFSVERRKQSRLEKIFTPMFVHSVRQEIDQKGKKEDHGESLDQGEHQKGGQYDEIDELHRELTNRNMDDIQVVLGAPVGKSGGELSQENSFREKAVNRNTKRSICECLCQGLI